jgi:hypothetical protein
VAVSPRHRDPGPHRDIVPQAEPGRRAAGHRPAAGALRVVRVLLVVESRQAATMLASCGTSSLRALMNTSVVTRAAASSIAPQKNATW